MSNDENITAEKVVDYLYYLKTHYPSTMIIVDYMDFAIKALNVLDTYKNVYHKGWEDGAEAVAFHEELSKDESGMVRKEDVIQILHKNWANCSGDDAMQMSIDDVRLL